MMTLTHRFVEYIPDEIEEGILYVSITFCTAIHKCVCGCGNEVVTPISKNGWKLSFDGDSVSLTPSIGSWNLNCRSHYFITNNNVRWARSWFDYFDLKTDAKSKSVKNYRKKRRKRK
ncbi:MAG: DUF6527 family protein [Paludibacter sp.]|nr:DUF6527 family protein [Paludibacter sp.]